MASAHGRTLRWRSRPASNGLRWQGCRRRPGLFSVRSTSLALASDAGASQTGAMRPSHAWRQHGTVSLWRYPDGQRNFPGWHLGADADGCASLLALLGALEADGAGTSRTVQLLAPDTAQLAVPNNRDAKWDTAQTLRLTVDAAADAWQWLLDGQRLELRIGMDALRGLRHGVQDIATGRGDYSVGSGTDALWFWWWPRG